MSYVEDVLASLPKEPTDYLVFHEAGATTSKQIDAGNEKISQSIPPASFAGFEKRREIIKRIMCFD